MGEKEGYSKEEMRDIVEEENDKLQDDYANNSEAYKNANKIVNDKYEADKLSSFFKEKRFNKQEKRNDFKGLTLPPKENKKEDFSKYVSKN